MMHSLDALYFDRFSQTCGEELARQIASVDVLSYRERVPAEWLEIVRAPSAASVRQLWGESATNLPRFVEYLASSIEGAAIVEVKGAPVLMIALPDWDESYREVNPGFCWIGTPTEPRLIRSFVDQVGAIPPSLEALWRVANFVTTKQPSRMCSLDETARHLAEAPRLLPPSLADDDGERYECLKIAVVNGEQTTCLVRPVGSPAWQDCLAVRFTSTQDLSWGVKRQLDGMLVDESAAEDC